MKDFDLRKYLAENKLLETIKVYDVKNQKTITTNFKELESMEDEDFNAIEESLRSLIAKGLIAVTLLGGGLKIHSLAKQQKADRKARIEYYETHLADKVSKTSSEDLVALGFEIDKNTQNPSAKRMVYPSPDLAMDDKEEFDRVLDYSAEKYARQYMESFPQEFAFGIDGNIYWLGN